LVTFTPSPLGRGVEDSNLPFGFFAEEYAQVHIDLGFITFVPPSSWPVNGYKMRVAFKATIKLSQGRSDSPGVACDPQVVNPELPQAEAVWSDLMNPHPQPRGQGTLVASKPTEEGALGSTRNTYFRGSQEDCHDLYFFIQANP
jgi:hypothetical protein